MLGSWSANVRTDVHQFPVPVRSHQSPRNTPGLTKRRKTPHAAATFGVLTELAGSRPPGPGAPRKLAGRSSAIQPRSSSSRIVPAACVDVRLGDIQMRDESNARRRPHADEHAARRQLASDIGSAQSRRKIDHHDVGVGRNNPTVSGRTHASGEPRGVRVVFAKSLVCCARSRTTRRRR